MCGVCVSVCLPSPYPVFQLALVQRKIDDMPSRSELQQYQRAFTELYEQVAARLTETRQVRTITRT